MAVDRIRIRLKAYDHVALDRSVDEIVQTVKRSGARIAGPVPLPTSRSIYTVLRGPHVDKKSREQFETRVHKRLIDIYDSTPQTVDALMKLDLPAGIGIDIKAHRSKFLIQRVKQADRLSCRTSCSVLKFPSMPFTVR